jgi:hypothetical protein
MGLHQIGTGMSLIVWMDADVDVGVDVDVEELPS